MTSVMRSMARPLVMLAASLTDSPRADLCAEDPPVASTIAAPVRGVEHTVVFAAEDTFAGWPANNGLWFWRGREILVGFTVGDPVERRGHNVGGTLRSVLSRSRDGGLTWHMEDPEGFVGDGGQVQRLENPIDFLAEGLALRVEGTEYHGSDAPAGRFYVSRDRGRHWNGPFPFEGLAAAPELRGRAITARTDYVPLGRRECLFLMSARSAAGSNDRVFVAWTTDGGRTFTFRSWIVSPLIPHRALMPSTALSANGQMISAIRRIDDATSRGWIEAYSSADDGRTWTPLGRLAETGGRNGNPSALVRFHDGRLGCIYGDRTGRQILVRTSRDAGVTWGKEAVLRDDYHPDRYGDIDLGYPRIFLREDGCAVTVYYWATQERPQGHIAATIWKP